MTYRPGRAESRVEWSKDREEARLGAAQQGEGARPAGQVHIRDQQVVHAEPPARPDRQHSLTAFPSPLPPAPTIPFLF